ncbi:YbaY family lipoprotein [Salinicola salarius]|uniref:YbaY family lipoprotein n=1 Tax=Salinicola salarius TaxID=430457 RepID=UPI0023E3988E|nr:YbaY family lipoprotein [Salinicola salarius]MDF3920394.1 YbaY family lipoprotein [Salinicola salarius]
MLSPKVPRPLRLVTMLFALVVLAGCAGGPQFDTLAARVVSEKPITLPDSATLEVQLKDVSTGDVLASSRYERLGQLPIPITLQYAAEAIDPDDLYRLSAQIRDDDRILYLNPEPVSVFADGDPTEPDIPVTTTGADTRR